MPQKNKIFMMTDEIKKEEKPEEEKKEDDPLSDLAKVADRIEKSSLEAKETLRKMEEIAARNLLGGKSDTGVQPQQAEKEETPEEYAARVMRGEIEKKE